VWIERLIFLSLLLAAELTLLTLPFDATRNLSAGSIWLGLLEGSGRDAAGLVALVFFSRLVIADELRKVAGASRGGATSVAPLAWDSPDAGRFSGGRNRASGSNLSGFCLRSRGLVVAVGRAVVRSLHQLESGVTTRAVLDRLDQWQPSRVFGVVAVACVAVLLGSCRQVLWTSLQRSTFEMVVVLLEAAGYRQLIVEPQTSVIGTSGFAVRISPQCSGFEGIGLICAVLGVCCWFYRRELRFPAALCCHSGSLECGC
jgi:hypothetical protein